MCGGSVFRHLPMACGIISAEDCYYLEKMKMQLISGAMHRLGLPYQVRAPTGRFRLHGKMQPLVAWKVKNGIYEREEIEAGNTVFDFSLPLLEFGGGIGCTSIAWNPKLIDPKKHLVVECNPASQTLVNTNARLNGAKFWCILGAVGYDCRRASVDNKGWIRTSFSLDDQLSVHGHNITVAPISNWTPWQRFNLALDVEGMEYEILAREMDLLRHSVSGLVIDWTPSRGDTISAIRALENAGFRWEYHSGNKCGFRNSAFDAADIPSRAGGEET